MILGNLSDLSEKEILEKIDDLSRKYFIAGANQQLQEQIASAIDLFKIELEERKFKNKPDQGNNDLDNLINID
jgi:hypothetical protein